MNLINGAETKTKTKMLKQNSMGLNLNYMHVVYLSMVVSFKTCINVEMLNHGSLMQMVGPANSKIL